jgi:hypothetical protein
MNVAVGLCVAAKGPSRLGSYRVYYAVRGDRIVRTSSAGASRSTDGNYNNYCCCCIVIDIYALGLQLYGEC